MQVTDLEIGDVQEIILGRGGFARDLYPFYPLTSPRMPPPGPSFVDHASSLAGEPVVRKAKGQKATDTLVNDPHPLLSTLYLYALYSPGRFSIPVQVDSKRYDGVRVIPGHLWGAPDDFMGPSRRRDQGPQVMVVSKSPGKVEDLKGRNFCGPQAEYLCQTLEKLGVPEPEWQDYYVTNIVRWFSPDPAGRTPAGWFRDGQVLLQEELRIVRPDYILLLGAEAAKAVVGTSKVSNLSGRAIDVEIPIHLPGEEPQVHVAKAFCVAHPGFVLKNTDQAERFEAELADFLHLVRTGELPSRDDDFEIAVVNTLAGLRGEVDRVLAHAGLKPVAVDGEWHGQFPADPGSYLRTVQFCHDPNRGVVVEFTKAGGEWAFDAPLEDVVSELRRLLDRDDVQLIGSFFAADLPWLLHAGIDLRHRYKVSEDLLGVLGGDYAGGFDVALACHAIDETGEFKLELMGVRYCRARRWDVELQKWKEGYCKRLKLEGEKLEGYGECPAEILYPYGGLDAIYTRRLRDVFRKKLFADVHGEDCWQAFHTSMKAFPAFVELSLNGLLVDLEQVDDLTSIYLEKIDELRDNLRHELAWPAFNESSVIHRREVLFGEHLNGAKRSRDGSPKRVRPEGARCLRLKPVTASGKRPKSWDRVERDGETDALSPSTDKQTLGILGATCPEAMMLRDLSFLGQVRKSFLRPPAVHKKTGSALLRADGSPLYDGGIMRFVRSDGRVHPRFFQTKETGRASAADPNIQAISKRRESDYKRILQARYMAAIRTVFTGVPPGIAGTEPTVLIEADYATAELLVVAILSGDANMVAHCLDPNYDIHSNVAKLAFKLDVEPLKEVFDGDLRLKALRTAAKNVIFGINYGRGAEAIARQCREEGIDISTEQAQMLIEAIFVLYPAIPEFQSRCAARVSTPGFIRNVFGRLRRFTLSDDRTTMGELERQAMNFPIQSAVADAISNAMFHLMTHPEKEALGYRLAVQIHDAIVLEVPVRSAKRVRDVILPECMRDKVAFPRCDLGGKVVPGSPLYRFSIDTEVMWRWGEKLKPDNPLTERLGLLDLFAPKAN